jgi:hypothetical protein
VARSSGQLILDRSFTHFDLGCARAWALCLIARSARCDVRWSPPSSSDLVKLSCDARLLIARNGVSPVPPADRRHEHRALSRSSRFAKRLSPTEDASVLETFRSSLLHSSAAPSDARATVPSPLPRRRKPTRSSRFAKHALGLERWLLLDVCFALRSCTRQRRLPTLAHRAVTARELTTARGRFAAQPSRRPVQLHCEGSFRVTAAKTTNARHSRDVAVWRCGRQLK